MGTKKNSIIRVLDVIPASEIEKWKNGDVITISAGCGAGKSYFIKNVLCEYAKNNHKKILMLIHRKYPAEQFKIELENDYKDDIIDVKTYQTIESIVKNGGYFDFSRYSYLICDEFHYFLEDSTFNHFTDLSFSNIINQNKITRIFMSATGHEMQTVLNNALALKYKKKKHKIYNYTVPISFVHIKTLTFWTKIQTIEELMQQWNENGDKAIIFLHSAKEAYELHKKFDKNSLFLCGSSSEKYYKYVKSDKVIKMLTEQKFEQQFLITTACFDAGSNIIDMKVNKIVVDLRDEASMLQCVGRKRVQNDNDKIDLYIKVYSRREMNGDLKKSNPELIGDDKNG